MPVDPVLVSVLGKKIEAVTREMTRVIERTSRSPLLQIRDFTAAVLDADHRMLSQDEGLPLMAYGFSGMLDHLVDQLGASIRPGDVFVQNDPYAGNNQAQDTAILQPVFCDGVLRFWTATKGHLADLGGRSAGGYDPDATDLWQETIRIPPVRLVAEGCFRADVWNVLMANSRFPELVGGDLRALMGACGVGERRLLEMVDRYGAVALFDLVDVLLHSSEQRMRAEIAGMRPGTYESESSWELPDGLGRRRLVCRLAATIGDGAIRLDFSGSDPQIDRYYNGAHGTSYAAAMATVLMLVDPTMPHNDGVERCVELVLPVGSFLNAEFPAPTVLGNFTMNDVIGEAVMRALAPAVPDRVTAGWGRGLNVSLYGTDPVSGEDFYAVPLLSNKCGGGATEGVDGWDAIGLLTCGGGFAFDDYEVFEATMPIRLVRHEYWAGSAGEGQWRGGLGIEVAYELLAETTVVSFGDGTDEPYGLGGGRAGSGNVITLLRPDGARVVVHANTKTSAPPGSILEMYNAGGGGFGPPERRDRAAVAADVEHGILDPARARAVYGVDQ